MLLATAISCYLLGAISALWIYERVRANLSVFPQPVKKAKIIRPTREDKAWDSYKRMKHTAEKVMDETKRA